MTKPDIEAILRYWQQKLGLGSWNIRIRWELAPSLDDEGKMSEATIACAPDYDQASLRINPDTFPSWTQAFANETIVHELLHCYERGVRNANIDVALAMPTGSYQLHWARYEHEAERWIDNLSIAIVRMMGLA